MFAHATKPVVAALRECEFCWWARVRKTSGMTATVLIARTTPKTVDAVAVPVGTTGTVPRSLGLSRAALAAIGFDGKVGQTLVVP